MTPYAVIRFDNLAAGILNGQLAAAGTGVTSVTVLELPGGVAATLRIGAMGQKIPIRQDDQWTYDPCVGPETDGIWFDCPPGGGSAVFVVFFGGGAVGRA